MQETIEQLVERSRELTKQLNAVNKSLSHLNVRVEVEVHSQVQIIGGASEVISIHYSKVL